MIVTNEDIGKICEYLLQGLSEDEACTLCDIDSVLFQEAKSKTPKISKLIEKAKIEFKLAHLKEIQAKKSGNNSQWILEKLRPEEFGTKAKDQQPSINIINQIIQSIQNGEETSRITPKTRGELLIEQSEKLEPGSLLN